MTRFARTESLADSSGTFTSGRSFRGRLLAFFAAPLHEAIHLQHRIEGSDVVNVDLAIETYLEQRADSVELLGFHEYGGFEGAVSGSGKEYDRICPPSREPKATDVETDRVCVARGARLIETGAGRLAVSVRPSRSSIRDESWIEVLAFDAGLAKEALDQILESMLELNVYRGKVITLSGDRYSGPSQIHFTNIDVPRAEDIILPESHLGFIARTALDVHRHRERLLAAGHHLKRGILFHGPPGTGKTLTVRYLLGELEEHTRILLRGGGYGHLQTALRLARELSPAVLVLEDVDLIGVERSTSDTPAAAHGVARRTRRTRPEDRGPHHADDQSTRGPGAGARVPPRARRSDDPDPAAGAAGAAPTPRTLRAEHGTRSRLRAGRAADRGMLERVPRGAGASRAAPRHRGAPGPGP